MIFRGSCHINTKEHKLCFSSQGERTFSEEEEEKLQAALSLEKHALNLVLETAAFILEQVRVGHLTLLQGFFLIFVYNMIEMLILLGWSLLYESSLFFKDIQYF